MGTPKTLVEAIQNGLKHHQFTLETDIYNHVADFINQRLAVMMFTDDQNVVKAIKELQQILLFKVKE